MLVELALRDPVFLPQEVHVELLTGTRLAGRDPVRFKPSNERTECSVVLQPFTASTDDEELKLDLSATLVYLLARLSARPDNEFMLMVEHAFQEGLTHKLHVARPYDDVANLLGDAHYDALAAVSVQPFPGVHARYPAMNSVSRPRPAPATTATLRWKISVRTTSSSPNC